MNKRVIIVGAGERICPKETIKTFSDIICADGGYNHIKNILKPNLIIGDFDSLSIKNIPKGISVKRFPKKKDETDIELAIKYSLINKYNPIYLTGVTGSRDDHFITAIMLLEKYKNNEIHILTEKYDIFIMNEKCTYTFERLKFSYVSFFSLSNVTTHLESEGFEYDYEDISLPRNNPFGVSNKIIKNISHIEFKKGLVLCFLRIY
ncbi:MAG: thiamine diphosphokinase [bacterium (Candidatus Stahlbacteria) CG23_combo_of_CG06-09_8_20_14_all_34_7]|nr:MAG: thiamine diphosphokinase [bacterium (Candidatus Stahlbacteria) CG23_combo_of_CG06-09_8_20_14_all_34_7]